MHIRKLFLLVVIFTLVISSCTKEKKIVITGDKGGTIVIGVPEEPSKLNPLYPPISGENSIINNLFLSLHSTSSEGDIIPMLASSWEYGEDMKSITYHLKKDLNWSDGKPITAEDIVFTFNAMKDPKNSYPNLSQIQYIKNVEALNDYSVKFEFSIVYSDELFDSNIRPIPSHIFNKEKSVKDSKYNETPVVSGPFTVKKWEKGDYIELIYNKNFNLFSPNPANIVFIFYKDYNDAIDLLKRGILDVAIGLDPKYYNVVKANPLLIANKESGSNYTFIGWNLNNELFKDKEVRQALTMTTNRKEIIDTLLNGLGDIIAGPIPPSSWAYNEALKPFPFSIEKAQKKLDNNGWKRGKRAKAKWLYKNGKRFEFDILVNKENKLRIDLANMLKNQFDKIGIKVNVNIVDGISFITKLLTKDYDAFIMAWNVGDKLNMLPIWSSNPQIGTYNIVEYKNPKLDDYIKNASETLIENDALNYWSLFQEEIANDQPYTFLFSSNKITISNKRVKGTDVFNKQTEIMDNISYLWIPKSMRVKFDIASLIPPEPEKKNAPTEGEIAEKEKSKKELANPEQILEAAAKKTTIVKDTIKKKPVVKTDTVKKKKPVIVIQPRPKNIVQPEYPEAAKLIGAEGQIFVQVTIGVDGNVKAAKIVKSFNNDACNKASIKAALRSKWHPGTGNGKPVEMKATYPYIFIAD